MCRLLGVQVSDRRVLVSVFLSSQVCRARSPPLPVFSVHQRLSPSPTSALVLSGWASSQALVGTAVFSVQQRPPPHPALVLSGQVCRAVSQAHVVIVTYLSTDPLHLALVLSGQVCRTVSQAHVVIVTYLSTDPLHLALVLSGEVCRAVNQVSVVTVICFCLHAAPFPTQPCSCRVRGAGLFSKSP